MKKSKEQELYEKRQLEIANSLYELGLDEDIIKAITKMEMDQVLRFRNDYESSLKEKIDSNKENRL